MSGFDDEGFDGHERRAGALSEQRAQKMIDEAVKKAVESHDQDMRAFIKAQFDELNTLIRSAFPDGDPDGHRRAHEAEIKSAERWARIKLGVMEKVVTGGIWGLLLFMGLAAWEHFKKVVSQ